MPKPGCVHEIEIKLRVASLSAIQATLKRFHARVISPRSHEFNTLYDTPSQALRQRGQLIRIRTERIAGRAGRKQVREPERSVLTYKAPIRTPKPEGKRSITATVQSRFKIREETEVTFSGADSMDQILRGLGLIPQFRYEKYRTTFVLPRISGLKIELDETPVGNYIELEGSPSGIDRAASLLGYAPSEYITATYGGLYLADCRRCGEKPGDMLFRNEKKSR
jgi:adenylate cyclase class 2